MQSHCHSLLQSQGVDLLQKPGSISSVGPFARMGSCFENGMAEVMWVLMERQTLAGQGSQVCKSLGFGLASRSKLVKQRVHLQSIICSTISVSSSLRSITPVWASLNLPLQAPSKKPDLEHTSARWTAHD